MTSNKSKKTIFITGCSTGIGLDIAIQLQKSDYHVIASCRKMKDVARLNENGIECIELDLQSSESIDKTVAYLNQHASNLYALINNAAYGQPGAVEDLSREVIKKQFETNVFGTMELTNKLLPLLRQQPHARVIQISSILGFICARYRGAYNASKYALEALTDTMRLELSHTNIQFSLIEPGPIESHFRDNAYSHFEQNIDEKNSFYRQNYIDVKSRLLSDKQSKGTLPAHAVTRKVFHALNSKRAKIRYRVCRITWMAAIAKRIFPDRLMDYLIMKGEN